MEILTVKKENEFGKGLTKRDFSVFLHNSLDKFRDSVEDIEKAIDYAFSDESGKGGFILTAFDNGELVSGLVMNNTGHSGYIPENILVYIATRPDQRGKGVGKSVMIKALEEAGTDVALHVEYDNPAKRLYERLGFESKYAEMRYKKK
jgi:[ribosomal protein S18]-alanine N-acetyltransferase